MFENDSAAMNDKFLNKAMDNQIAGAKNNFTPVSLTSKGGLPMFPEYSKANPVGTLGINAYNNLIQAQKNLQNKATIPVATPPPDSRPYEDPGPPPMFSPQGGGGDKPKIQALPDYNPQYENASRENYATQMGEMRGALDPRISQRGAITNELLNYRPSGGQSAAAALSLLFENMGAQDSIATTAATQKGGLAPLNLQGIHFGNEARVYGQKERFKEGQESTQAQIGLHKAQTQKSIQDANTQKPQAALAGYMDEYLAGLKPEQRNEIVKSQLMGKKDKQALSPEIMKHVLGQKEGMAMPSSSQIKALMMGTSEGDPDFKALAMLYKDAIAAESAPKK